MIRLTRSHVQPIGLDIGHDSVKMLQLEVINDGLSVVAAAQAPLGPEVRAEPHLRMLAAGDAVRRLLGQAPFLGRRVIASLPREMVHVKNLRLPLMPAPELQSAIQYEAKTIFPFDTDTAQVQYMPVGEVRQGVDVLQEVIVLAVKNDELDAYVEQLHRCGVIIDSLDVEFCAFYRTVERFIRRREDEQEVHVLVDLGSRRSQVVIGKGKELNFYKPIEIGSLKLAEAVGRKLGVSLDEAVALRRRLAEGGEATETDRRDPVRQAVFDATRPIQEELAREIALCLRYYSVTFRGHRPNKVRLYGGESCDAQTVAMLNSSLPIPAEPGRPLYSVNTASMKQTDRRGTMCEWAMAMALGLKRTQGRFGPRDGKPRDLGAGKIEAGPSIGQTIDLNRAVAAAAGEEDSHSRGAARTATLEAGRSHRAEVTHA